MLVPCKPLLGLVKTSSAKQSHPSCVQNLKRKRASSGTPVATSTQAVQTQDSSTQAVVFVPSMTSTTRSMAIAYAVVLKQQRRDILRNLNLLPHLAVATPVPLSERLRSFLFHRRFVNSVGIHSLEVGGNGDCLCHSVAAGLERLLLQSTAASRHVLRRALLTVFSSCAQAVAQQLRNMCADQIEHWTWEELLNYSGFLEHRVLLL